MNVMLLWVDNSQLYLQDSKIVLVVNTVMWIWIHVKYQLPLHDYQYNNNMPLVDLIEIYHW